jgi:hypothetical protein
MIGPHSQGGDKMNQHADTRPLRLVILIVAAVCLVQSPAGRAQATQGTTPDKPFAVEYYYKVKWGYADEFIQLYKKNHHPLLKQQMRDGRIVDLKTEAPFYHAGEDSRWDYRVTIVWKNSTIAHDDYDGAAHIKKLFPDQETFKREEQRRFEPLLGHSDIAVVPVDMEK